jgi:hypothetical protein
MDKINLKKALQDLVEEYKAKLKAQAKIDKTYATGNFANSFKSKVVEDGFEISSDVKYAGAIDDGSKKARQNGKVSAEKYSAIAEWAKAKNIRPISSLSGGYKFRKMNTNKKSAFRSMVFAIANSIAKKGTIKRFQYKGSDIFDRVYKSMQKKIGSELSEAIAIDLKNDIAKIINKTQ